MRYLYLIVLLLAGCAPNADMVKLASPETVVVTWNREAPTYCGSHKVANGCALSSPGYRTCSIWAREDVSDAVLGHELRHCFGYEHESSVRKRDAQKAP